MNLQQCEGHLHIFEAVSACRAPVHLRESSADAAAPSMLQKQASQLDGRQCEPTLIMVHPLNPMM